MPLNDSDAPKGFEAIDAVYRSHSRHVFATLVRLLRDFDVAEEALHDAFMAALEQWPYDGIPTNPRAWLVSTGRFKGIDNIRRRTRFEPLPENVEGQFAVDLSDELDGEGIEDDRLRLIFTCCHPALAPDAVMVN
jgi:RNA polymerase sigma-70 factor, ECF subfamily